MDVCKALRLTQLGAKYGHGIGQSPAHLPLYTYKEIKAATSQDEATPYAPADPATSGDMASGSPGSEAPAPSPADSHPPFLEIYRSEIHALDLAMTSRFRAGNFLHAQVRTQPELVSHAMVGGVRTSHAIITGKMLTRFKDAAEVNRGGPSNKNSERWDEAGQVSRPG